jgi:hypothetical protein
MQKCAHRRLRLPRPSQKQFEYDLNCQKNRIASHPRVPNTSQQQHKHFQGHERNNQHEKSTKMTHVPLAFVPSSLALKGGWFGPPGAVDLLGVAVNILNVGGGLVRREPSICWGLLSTSSTRKIFDGNESSGLVWALHGLS